MSDNQEADMYSRELEKTQKELKDKNDLIIILKMKLNGARERFKERDQEIAQLKEELKREREAVDELLRVHGMHDKDLANYEWETCCNGHMCGCYGMPTDPGYYEYNSRESARQTQQQRK